MPSLSAPLSSQFNHSLNFLDGHIFASIYLLQQIKKRLLLAPFCIIYTCIGDDAIGCHHIASEVCRRWVWTQAMPFNYHWWCFDSSSITHTVIVDAEWTGCVIFVSTQRYVFEQPCSRKIKHLSSEWPSDCWLAATFQWRSLDNSATLSWCRAVSRIEASAKPSRFFCKVDPHRSSIELLTSKGSTR